MKLLLLVVLLAGVAVLVGSGNKQQNKPEEIIINQGSKEVTVDHQTYAYSFMLSDPEKSKLVANFEDKLSSEELVIDYNCTGGINGGFYDESGKPLGWWEAEGIVRNEYTRNNLLNGIVGVSNRGELVITEGQPTGSWTWGMQSGPVLVESGNLKVLSMNTDKPARRSVLAKASDGKMVMLSIFGVQSQLDGPTLVQLPAVVRNISDREGWQVAEAINLDGGSASAFYSLEKKLSEVVTVGSWICATN